MAVAELSIPQGWDAITPEWMTTVLAGHCPGARVDDVRVALRDDGTLAALQDKWLAGAGKAPVLG